VRHHHHQKVLRDIVVVLLDIMEALYTPLSCDLVACVCDIAVDIDVTGIQPRLYTLVRYASLPARFIHLDVDHMHACIPSNPTHAHLTTRNPPRALTITS
jgi:hypothetical protein